MKYTPHPYQDFSLQHVLNQPYTALLLEVGLGKSVISLTAIDQLLYHDFAVSKPLIIAPKRVAENTWGAEIAKWDHLKHLTISKIMGTVQQRLAAIKAKADIYIVNRDNVAWLVTHHQSAWPYDMVVLDELSSFKNAQAVRFKALRMIRPKIRRVIGLTGTPAPNGLIDLWPQIYLLDQGERLGKTITGFRQEYFSPGRTNGHIVYDYRLRKDTEGRIHEKIGDICISMKAKDYLDLPERIDRIVEVVLDEKEQKRYDEFERNQVLALLEAEGGAISALSAAALTGKLLQFANGALYDAKKAWHEVHTAKLDVLEEMIEALQGKPVIVVYTFKHDYERGIKRVGGELLEEDDVVERWNRGEIPVLWMYPTYGLNLQFGGHNMIWFGQTWSLELWLQQCGRIERQGQEGVVVMQQIVVKGSMDEDVVAARAVKADTQEALMSAVKARVDKYR
jgi:SNF2 family DNA or RNA helicase